MATTTTASPSPTPSWKNDSNNDELLDESTPPDLTDFFDDFISGGEKSVQIDCHVGRNRLNELTEQELKAAELKIVKAVNGVKDEKLKQLEEKNMKLEIELKNQTEWMENDSKEREDVLAQLQAAMTKINNLEQVSCRIHFKST